jgi:hypothetical protein
LHNDPDIRVAVKDINRGYITNEGITIGELAQSISDARLPSYSNPDKNGQGSCGVSYTFGVQAAKIRIEKKTGKSSWISLPRSSMSVRSSTPNKSVVRSWAAR